jgi:hypothetical protein
MPVFQRNSQNAAFNAAFGYQNLIQGTSIAASTPPTQFALNGNTPLVTMVLAASTAYAFFIPTAGASTATILLSATFTAAPTITVYPCAANGVSQKPLSTTTSITLTTATPSSAVIAALQGENGLILNVTTGTGSTVFTVAEYTAL